MRHRTAILALMACLASATGARAQEVFNQVVNTAKLAIDDPQANGFILQVSQFKYTAMQYLCTTAIKRNGGSVGADLLDRQAAAMNEFVTQYFADLARAQKLPGEEQAQIMRRYWKASASCPMFPNVDKAEANAFVTDAQSLTPFSLNTDWEKALKALAQEKTARR